MCTIWQDAGIRTRVAATACRQVFTSPWKKSTEVAVADLELLVPRPYTLPSVIFPPSILVFPGHPAMFEVYVVLPCAPLLPNPHSPK